MLNVIAMVSPPCRGVDVLEVKRPLQDQINTEGQMNNEDNVYVYIYILFIVPSMLRLALL